MIEIYRKRGRSVRREGAHLIWVDEAGEAIEENGAFHARALDEAVDLPQPDAEAVDAAAREIESLAGALLSIERLIVSEGTAEHECDGIRWTETSRRVHLSMARPPLRALIDLAEFRFDVVRRVAEALLGAGNERGAPARVRVAEHVGAVLLPSLSIGKFQTAAPHDGRGGAIEERRVAGKPPNWFRPSYRLRPRRAWFHVRAEEAGEIDDHLPEAVALLAPVEGSAIRVLCVDRSRVYPATLDLRRVLAARSTPTWYPYGAGCFGAQIML